MLSFPNMHSDRLKQSLSTSQRVSPLTERGEDVAVHEPAPEDRFKSLINVLSDKMDYIAAAMGKPNPGALGLLRRHNSRHEEVHQTS